MWGLHRASHWIPKALYTLSFIIGFICMYPRSTPMLYGYPPVFSHQRHQPVQRKHGQIHLADINATCDETKIVTCPKR